MKRSSQLFFIIALTLWLAAIPLSNSTALAGGWAAITLDAWPTQVIAGQPLTIGFVVRQHGRTPMADLTPQIQAVHQGTQTILNIPAHPEGETGHYVATLTFPQAGEWRWTIEAFTMIQPMPPLAVQPAISTVSETQAPNRAWPFWVGGLGLLGFTGASVLWWRRRVWWASIPAVAAVVLTGAGFVSIADPSAKTRLQPASAPSQAEIGQALFVAKGCITCHRHNAIQEIPNIFPEIGPDLTNFPTTPEYLRTWLKDPQAIKPNTAMPDLELKQTEIEALIAFLLNSESPQQAEAATQPQPAKNNLSSDQVETLKPAGNSPAELLFVRTQGAKGPLVVYGMPQAREEFSLPAGLPTLDWRRYYAATTQPDNTLLETFDPYSGRLERSSTLAGQWSLSAVSPSGRWLVLTRIPGDDEKALWTQEKRWQTSIQIVNSETGQVDHALQLEGNFEVETISAAGDSLFLIEHQPAINPTHYLIRLYDLAAAKLQPDPLRSKTADEVMTGLAWGGLASPDGRWLLTLYLNTARDVAFIHALDLENKSPICIDLPSGSGDMTQLKHYTLALAPHGQTVYAANTALGIIAEVSLTSFNVVRTAKFPAASPTAVTAQTTFEIPTNYSAMSQDGNYFYFSSGWDIWGYDTQSKQVAGPYLSGLPIRGLGLSQDQQQLYIALEGQTPRVIDLKDGQELSFSD